MRERERAPAKVNLRLRVHERESSGYHRLETLFCALELADEITLDVSDGGGVSLDVEGPDLGPPEANLAVRAAVAFLEAAGVPRSVSIRLKKRIPAGGGLGGGSSDAAAVLRCLDRMLPGAVAPDSLVEIARQLGSDVPFLLSGETLALGAGRGDVLTAAPPLPSVPVLLVFPPFPVSTAAAYGWLDQDRGEAGPTAAGPGPAPAPPASWREAARDALNDFEGPVFRRHPLLADVRNVLAESGAMIALLAGSGSTLFGVFPDEEGVEAATAALRARAPETALVRTRTAASR